MKNLLKGLLSLCIIPLVFVGCTTTTKQPGQATTPAGKRIYIPQERVQYDRKAHPKTVPYVYTHWVSALDNLSRVREYEVFLERHGVGNIIPSFELMRTARDWAKCGRSQYMIPSRELWANQIPTLKVFKYLVAANVLTDFEVTSVYRDLPLNPQAQDYSYIENTKFKLCQFWVQHGQSLNMGLGMYASGQIHIDTQGYRTWGPSLGRNSSMCNY